MRTIAIFGYYQPLTFAARSVAAGRQAIYTIILDNLGNSPELVRLSPAGARASWISPAQNSTIVNYSGSSQIEIRVRPGPEVMPGNYRLSLLASEPSGYTS